MPKLKEITISAKLTLQETRGHFMGTELSATYEIDGSKKANEEVQIAFDEMFTEFNAMLDKSVEERNFVASTKGGK